MSDGQRGAWFGPEAGQALTDFWRVFEAHYDAIADATLPEAAAIEAALGEAEDAALNRAEVRSAFSKVSGAMADGDWAAVEATLQARGARFARLGMNLITWTDFVLATKAHTVPRLVEAYSADPSRLAAAICAMERFWDRSLRVAWRTFQTERETIAEEQRQLIRERNEALRRSEARFARLAESGIVGILFAGFDGHIQDANDAFLKMVGYSRGELESGRLSWETLTPSEYRPQSERIGKELHESGVAMPVEKEYLRKDGTRVSVIVGVAVLEGSECIGFVLDITERRRLEHRLQHAQKMEAIGSLAGGVAHDFNNLLSAILGYSSLLLQGLPPGSALHDDATEIHRAGERAAGLTRQLLALSRKQRLNPEVINLGTVVSEMQKLFRRLIGENIDLVTALAPHLRNVKADPSQIEQVIMNLVVNARDAMPGGGTLTIETSNVDVNGASAPHRAAVSAGSYVRLTVSDTGTGMDAATQERIFEPFFTTKKEHGTGLGLSTALGIVQQSGGSIVVQSEVGRGSRFDVYLPETQEPARIALPAAEALPFLRGNETILLVEDEAQVRKLARECLERHGCRVIEAAGPGEALRRSEQHEGLIHLMVTDMIMPQMTGRELAERLRSSRPEMRVLYMSGYVEGSLLPPAVSGEQVAFLPKPFTPDSLLRKVRSTLVSP
jgi:PAS domain S-box-containing protein